MCPSQNHQSGHQPGETISNGEDLGQGNILPKAEIRMLPYIRAILHCISDTVHKQSHMGGRMWPSERPEGQQNEKRMPGQEIPPIRAHTGCTQYRLRRLTDKAPSDAQPSVSRSAAAARHSLHEPVKVGTVFQEVYFLDSYNYDFLKIMYFTRQQNQTLMTSSDSH